MDISSYNQLVAEKTPSGSAEAKKDFYLAILEERGGTATNYGWPSVSLKEAEIYNLFSY